MIRLSFLLVIVALLYPVAGPARSSGEDEEPRYQKWTLSQLIVILRTETKNPKVHQAALIGLERIGPRYRRAAAAVAIALKEDKDETVREMAAQVLGKLAQGAHEIKEKELHDTAVDSRDGALEALRVALQGDKSARVREAAATAIGRVGGSDCAVAGVATSVGAGPSARPEG